MAADPPRDLRAERGAVALRPPVLGHVERDPDHAADVAPLLGERLDVDAASVLVTTGSQQAIDLLARSCCGRGDTVVVDGGMALPGEGRPHPRNNAAFTRKLRSRREMAGSLFIIITKI